MTVWTPSRDIAVKVIGLAWRGDELLVAEVEESDGRVKGVRPLGGGIEFGETREAALKREFAEELRCDVAIVGPWHAFENIYQHEGRTGHELIFAATIRTPGIASPRSSTIARRSPPPTSRRTCAKTCPRAPCS